MNKYINPIWLYKFIIDSILIGVYGFILYSMIIERWIFKQYRTCIPGITKNKDGTFMCGEIKNPSLNNPYISLSIGSPEAFAISIFPFILLILFNIIYFCIGKVPYPKNKKINRNFFIWVLILIQIISTGSATTTIIIHIIKYTFGLPRPNTYNNFKDTAFESFPSGHVGIAFVNCYLFGIFCQNALDYSMKNNYILPKPIQEPKSPNSIVVVSKLVSQEEKFNGHYWFFLPIWNLLKYFPTISYILVWLPMTGASYIALTRIREYWHNDIDCVTGALIGIACGHITYKRYYYEIYGI